MLPILSHPLWLFSLLPPFHSYRFHHPKVLHPEQYLIWLSGQVFWISSLHKPSAVLLWFSLIQHPITMRFICYAANSLRSHSFTYTYLNSRNDRPILLSVSTVTWKKKHQIYFNIKRTLIPFSPTIRVHKSSYSNIDNLLLQFTLCIQYIQNPGRKPSVLI
jgi:hypothetical protein